MNVFFMIMQHCVIIVVVMLLTLSNLFYDYIYTYPLLINQYESILTLYNRIFFFLQEIVLSLYPMRSVSLLLHLMEW